MGATQSQERQRGKQTMENPKKLPHNYQSLMKDLTDPPPEATTFDVLDPCVYKGVLLGQGQTKKYWVDEDNLQNCFMLFARAFYICWSENPNYWTWEKESLEDKRETKIEVARLLDVCWLELVGTFKSSDLSPGVRYEVSFEVKMEEESYGWNTQVYLKLQGPDGKTRERKEKLEGKVKGKWIRLPVGDFVNPRDNGGERKFSLLETVF